jgi:hypothetical protein
MAAETLVDRKVEASERLVEELINRAAPLLAAYWEYREERDRWSLVVTPQSSKDEKRLISDAMGLVFESQHRSSLSPFDLSIGDLYTKRARALGAYIRKEPYVGRRIDTTFTDGEYFESVIPVYFKPELMTYLSVAS